MNERRIYHITHVNNLRSILASGKLWSDSQRITLKLETVNIGHSHIKERRRRRGVSVAAGGMPGDYVPFNFCNRSVMLYVIHRNSVDRYDGGQSPIVHLVSSVGAAVATGRPWAFTNRHAELTYAEYFASVGAAAQVDWSVMPLQYWAEAEETKERRQAEFLMHDWFPFEAIEAIGVMTNAIAQQVRQLVAESRFSPRVSIKRSWCY